MKITLLNPPITVKQIYGKYSALASFQPPIGLCALAAYLIKDGHDVNIVDANVLNLAIKDIIKVIREERPRLAGIYTNTSNYYVVSRLVAAIKAQDSSQRIVLGGPHPTFLPHDTLSQTLCDYCIIGEGEETLSELVRFIEGSSKDLSRINGLAFRTDDNQIKINAPRNRIDDLDSIPFPAIHLLPDISSYRLYLLQYKRMPYMTLITSRGCPYKCVFCDTPFGKVVRFHSPAYVVDYLEYLSKRFGVRELHFCDDTFTLDEERIFKMCELIKMRGLDMTWYSATRANIKDKHLFIEMKKAGCWTCAIGVESGDPEILRLIRKHISLDDVKDTSEAILKAGLVLKAFFIIGNPGETLKTIERTIKFARSLKAHYPVFSLMTPFPGAELWDTAPRYGSFDRSNFEKLLISTSDPVFIPTGLTKEMLLRKQGEAFKRTYFNLGMVRRQLGTIRTLDDAKRMAKAAGAFLKMQFK